MASASVAVDFELDEFLQTQSNLDSFQENQANHPMKLGCFDSLPNDVDDMEILLQAEIQLTQKPPNNLYDTVVTINDEEILLCFRDISSVADRIRLLPDYGQRSAKWLDAMADFGSAKIYMKNVDELLLWIHEHPVSDEQLYQGVIRYMKWLHFEDLDEDGKPINAATTIGSKLSSYTKFFKFVHHINLKLLLPEAEDAIAKWSKKQDPAKQAKTMEDTEMLRLYQLPDEADVIPRKAFVGCSISFAGRGIEAHKLPYTKVLPIRNADNVIETVAVKYIRKQQHGVPVELTTFITGELEVNAVMTMYDAHTDKSKTGNFFQYIDPRTMKVRNVTNANVGHNELAGCGKLL